MPEVLDKVGQRLLDSLGHHDQRRPVRAQGLVGHGEPGERLTVLRHLAMAEPSVRRLLSCFQIFLIKNTIIGNL